MKSVQPNSMSGETPTCTLMFWRSITTLKTRFFVHGFVWCAAMAIGLGGNPYGPAGTGKTESVKALGGLFGRQVLVFNCDEVKFCAVMHSYALEIHIVTRLC